MLSPSFFSPPRDLIPIAHEREGFGQSDAFISIPYCVLSENLVHASVLQDAQISALNKPAAPLCLLS